MKAIRFMDNNFIERSFTYSSQLSDFPAINIFNTSRSKVWKPAGNFEINTGNNKLFINDGTNKTITLTNGSYLPATLAAHVQTQLNASSTNWVVTYDDLLTFKFSITRTIGTAILRQSVPTNTAWDTLGYTAGLDSVATVADQQRNHTSEWIQCDLGVPQQATFFGMISGIDEIFNLSETAVVKIKANNVDSWNGPPVELTVPVSSLGVFKILEDDVIATYRFWRIEIIDRLNYLGPEGVELAYAYIGDHVTVTLTNIARGFTKLLNDPSVRLQSENGASFFEIKPRYLGLTGCVIQLLNGQEQRDLEQTFYDLGLRTPYFVSIDPSTEVSQDLEELTRFVIMTRTPQLQHVFKNYYDVIFEMEESF